MGLKQSLYLFVSLTLIIVLFSANPMMVYGGFAGGSGTSEDPYQISDVYQLQDMSLDVSAHYILVNDIDASDTSTWNIGAGFMPISSFSGSFNGNGYTITDLYINRPSMNYVGLFGSGGSNCEIKLAVLENVDIVGRDHTGGLIGYAGTAAISYCSVTGSVSGFRHVGGLVGYSTGTISYSSVEIQVSGSYMVGGLIGYHYQGSISNSYSEGTVNATGLAGGFIGRFQVGSITNSFSTCNTGSEGSNFMDGFAGDCGGGSISNSYASGSVTGYQALGGFAGQCASTTITNSYSTGRVTGIVADETGGFIGISYSCNILGSYWDTVSSNQDFSAGGEGRTTAEMWQQSTYTGWDFTDIWSIEENVSYPKLWIEFIVAEAGPDQVTSVGSPVYFTGAYCLDFDRDIVSYDWDFGDGSTGSDLHANHTYITDGVYTVTLTVTNSDSKTDSDTCQVIVWFGAGSPEDPYQIHTLEQLQNMKFSLDAHYILMNDIDASDTVYWNGGTGFEPVGIYPGYPDYGTPFSGSLDGNGYIITGLWINQPGSSRFIGLFSSIQNAMINNVALDNIDVTGGEFIAGLVGYGDSSSITNSYVSGTVNGNRTVGGMAGFISNSSVLNCNFQGTVVGKGYSVGGLVALSNNNVITYCHVSGEVILPDSYSPHDCEIGGLAGTVHSGQIMNSYSDCDVTVLLLYMYYGKVGGFVGNCDATISNCFSTGNVAVPNLNYYSNSGIGGFGGFIFGSTNSFSTGHVTGGGGYTGGFAGQGFYITNCFSTGSVTSNGSHVGGFCGIGLQISSSYATGNVSGPEYVGGFGGTGANITDCWSTGGVTGDSGYTGGFIGACSGVISNSYSTGEVIGTGDYVGGFAGYAPGSGSFSSCYWDINTSGMLTGVGVGDPAGLFGKTTKEMKKQATFTGWDFVNIWDIDENASYPFHRSQNHLLIDPVYDLINLVINMDLPTGIEDSLLLKLFNLIAAIENDRPSAEGLLIGFINQVEAFRGLYLTDDQADELLAIAQWLNNYMIMS